MKLLSEKLKGMPKSEQHKANIAAAQKNRLAARRALQAIEAAHSSSGPYFDIGRQSRYLLCSPAMSGARSFVDLKKNKRNQSRAEVSNISCIPELEYIHLLLFMLNFITISLVHSLLSILKDL